MQVCPKCKKPFKPEYERQIECRICLPEWKPMRNDQASLNSNKQIMTGTEVELRIKEANEAVDWEHLALSNFIHLPHSKAVWIDRQFRMVRESKDGDGYVFDNTNNVKPHVNMVWYEMTPGQFMSLSIGELIERPENIVVKLGQILNYLLQDVHTLLGVANMDKSDSRMPRIYQYTQVGGVYVGTACWGNTIDEHGNETGKWGETFEQQIREMTGE